MSNFFTLHIPIINWNVCITLWIIFSCRYLVLGALKNPLFASLLSVQWEQSMCTKSQVLASHSRLYYTRHLYPSSLPVPECPTPKGQLNPVSAPNLGLQRGQNLLMYQENTELQANIFAFEHNRFAQYVYGVHLRIKFFKLAYHGNGGN